MDAMIESMATLTEQRVASGGAEAAANTLKSEAVQDSVADVITDAMAVWLEVDPEDEEEAKPLRRLRPVRGRTLGRWWQVFRTMLWRRAAVRSWRRLR